MTEREAWEVIRRVLNDEGHRIAEYGAALSVDSIRMAVLDLVKAARAEALADAARKMQEIAASRGHTGSKSVALFVAWCEGKEPHE